MIVGVNQKGEKVEQVSPLFFLHLRQAASRCILLYICIILNRDQSEVLKEYQVID